MSDRDEPQLFEDFMLLIGQIRDYGPVRGVFDLVEKCHFSLENLLENLSFVKWGGGGGVR